MLKKKPEIGTFMANQAEKVLQDMPSSSTILEKTTKGHKNALSSLLLRYHNWPQFLPESSSLWVTLDDGHLLISTLLRH